ncbi:hypothetical protein [Aquimarina agarivorans]|uniref:hypothetical protein n=1 Tax=Aquimarina agarivorans TaxID=980584 RepID=UPI000248EA8F|nr:hypothetical protein [Aquimarina agarivorans]
MRLTKILSSALLVVSLLFLCSWSAKESTDGYSIQKKKENVVYIGSKTFDISRQLQFQLQYTAKRNREVVVALKRKGVWIANGVVSVKKGSGIIKVPISLTSRLKRSKKYEIDFYIRPEGTTWKEAVTSINNMPNITIE